MPNYKEAYIAVIDFNKTIISITSAILAALITFLVFQDYGISLRNIGAPIILLISLTLSIAGIGRAIPAINHDQSEKIAVTLSNWGAGFMVIGIIAIILIRKPEKPTMDSALVNIEKTLSKTYPVINSKNCHKIQLENEEYVFYFQKDSSKRKVIYSIEKDKITATEIDH